MKDLISDYRNEAVSAKKQNLFDIIPILYAALVKAGLLIDLPYSGSEPIPIDIDVAASTTNASVSFNDKFIKEFTDYVGNITNYLAIVENRLFSEGLHVIGQPLSEGQIAGYLDAIIDNDPIKNESITPEMTRVILNGVMKRKSITEIIFQISAFGSTPTSSESGIDWIRDGFTMEDKVAWSILSGGPHCVDILSRMSDWFIFQLKRLMRDWGSKEAEDYIANYIAISTSVQSGNSAKGNVKDDNNLVDTITLAKKLLDNSINEMDYLIRGINGEYIESAPGGDIIRDGIATLPTGRNIYSLDPFRIPSQLAIQRGKEAALLILKQHKSKNQEYPETVAVTLWGIYFY